MPVPAETMTRGVKLEAMEGSQAVRKRTNSRRELLYRLLGGRLVLRLIAYYKETLTGNAKWELVVV